MNVLIELKKINKEYKMGHNVLRVLNDVDLKIYEGEFVAILGPSGSGKSTLMNILGCIDKPTSGEYIFNNEDITYLDEFKLSKFRNETIGFIFQKFNLLPKYSTLENVQIPLLIRGQSRKESKGRALKQLDQVGLKDRVKHKPIELSGGQQQRVAVARALVTHPKLLLADEPTGNLDSKSEEDIINLFKKLNQNGHTIIMITHSKEVASVAKRVITIKDGCII
ncbi:MAG: ABC transporter ATP-binding protein [Peptostreptococcaceae bacterium]|nr:ABC transporter ATP-binding protein [Peptostreptococcaceae bacterium]